MSFPQVSEKLQLQLFQAALVIVGMTCLFALKPASQARTGGLSRNVVAADCSARRVAVRPDSVLNLRTQPNGAIVRQLSSGQAVSIERYDSSGNWAEIVVGNNRGWVFAQYLVSNCV